ncbi:CAMK family protein kinase [Tritrichomonas foetus]|uniref:CAMK family protein kinase n=1 Tax=Tritrichomonas foetus TaxID=1144522 RepID=A0A1J4KWR0_9EUKA|nr:CAMK family protein kinase [Tritrichomonas foetus]|eukprot:OHT15602.1 CAMK family protein kinase [Tritrichomonas foetus]
MSQSVMMPSRIGPYIFRGSIGEGAFSIVKLAFHEYTQQYFACKIVPKTKIAHGNLEQRFEIEIRINQQMHHPGVVGIYDILKDNFNYYIMMEFCPNGELFQLIVDRKRVSEEESKPLIMQILETIDYIHKMGVAHRDLKPENILIDKLGRLKISDFGLSKFVDSKGLVSTPCGSPCYASPECVAGNGPYNGKTNDVWSIGVIVYAMLTGELPWTKRNQAQLFEQIKKGEYKIPDFLSEDATSFIRGLMTVDIKNRLTIQQAIDHPFLRGTMSQSLPKDTPVPIISLKRVDAFFEKDDTYEQDCEILRNVPERIPSNVDLNYEKTLREIVVKLPQLLMRKSSTSQCHSFREHIASPADVVLMASSSLRQRHIRIDAKYSRPETTRPDSRQSRPDSRQRTRHILVARPDSARHIVLSQPDSARLPRNFKKPIVKKVTI